MVVEIVDIWHQLARLVWGEHPNIAAPHRLRMEVRVEIEGMIQQWAEVLLILTMLNWKAG